MPALPPYDGAGSAEDSTLWLGAACAGACWTEPVTSFDACGLPAQCWPSNREKSLLQPARPAAKAAMMARRDTPRARDGSMKLDILNTHSYATDEGVKHRPSK